MPNKIDILEDNLRTMLDALAPTDKSLLAGAQAHLDNLTKPIGSLGRLEECAARLFLISGGRPPKADPARICVCAADHGVTAEGVSPFPSEVTRQMVLNFLNGGAGINVLCRTAKVDLKVVDAGCLGGDFPDHPDLIRGKIAPGTANLAAGPAMTRENCLRALLLGRSLADAAADQGYAAIGMGEMGIGNTTPATALYAAYLGLDHANITGPGAGLNSEGVRRKTEVIGRALQLHADVVASGDPIAILATLGGYEIATLAGLILGGAARRLAVVVDGFISTAAYVAAWKIHPAVTDYAFFAHGSAEPGHQTILKHLGNPPLLDLGLRLGEGTGAALAMFLLRSAAAIFNDMASFDSAGVSKG